MKKKYFLLIYCLNSLFVFGQMGLLPKSEIRLGGGMAFYEGKTNGAQAFADYSFPLNGYFAIVPGITGNLTLEKDEYSYSAYYSLGSTLSARFIPFPKKFDRLNIDFGGFYQYFISSAANFSGAPVSNYHTTNYGDFSKWDLYGLCISLSGNIVQGEKLQIGVKADRFLPFGTTEAGFACWQVGIYIAGRF